MAGVRGGRGGVRRGGGGGGKTHRVLFKGGVEADDGVIMLLHAGKELVHLRGGRRARGWGVSVSG